MACEIGNIGNEDTVCHGKFCEVYGKAEKSDYISAFPLFYRIFARKPIKNIRMITKNKFVTVSYELRTDKDGELLETAGADRPLEFICGQGQTLEYFEMNLLDKEEGDKFDFEIPAANAYGEVNEDMVVDLPKDIFQEVAAGDMVVGNVLPMMDSIGRRLQGKIESIGEEEVRVNFNHPLAGKKLFFKGEILGVRDATDEELEALHSHKCGGCSGCGSHDDGCGGCGSHDNGCGCCH